MTHEEKNAFVDGYIAGLEYAAYRLEHKNDETSLRCMIDLFRSTELIIQNITNAIGD